MKSTKLLLITFTSLFLSSSLLAAQSCAEKREELRERLKKCPTQACKEKVKKLIQDLDCNGKDNDKKDEDKIDNNNQGNNNDKPNNNESDCDTLIKLWTELEPLKKEGNPDTTKHILSLIHI